MNHEKIAEQLTQHISWNSTVTPLTTSQRKVIEEVLKKYLPEFYDSSPEFPDR